MSLMLGLVAAVLAPAVGIPLLLLMVLWSVLQPRCYGCFYNIIRQGGTGIRSPFCFLNRISMKQERRQ